MAAVLSCGDGAALSHETAGAHWGIRPDGGQLVVSTPHDRRWDGIEIHERSKVETVCHRGIPVTSPHQTLVDLATILPPDELEASINEADKRRVTDPEALRSGLERLEGRAGVATLRHVLDRRTFKLTDSALERRFLPIAHRVGMPPPLTGAIVNGYKVDFYWPDLGLVVETDGLRYHRTPAQQAKDRERDHAHAAAGLVSLRFTHEHVWFRPGYVEHRLTEVWRRLRAASD